jgi:hypothetical protein
VLVGDQIRLLRQRQQGGSVGLGADGNDLAVGAVDPAATDRQPGLEGPVELGDRIEDPAGDHMVAHDVDLPLDASFAGGAVGGQHVDGEPVVLGERSRFRVQPDRNPGSGVALDHRLCDLSGNPIRQIVPRVRVE